VTAAPLERRTLEKTACQRTRRTGSSERVASAARVPDEFASEEPDGDAGAERAGQFAAATLAVLVGEVLRHDVEHALADLMADEFAALAGTASDARGPAADLLGVLAVVVASRGC
jgi:hypothetical protein